MAQKIQGSMLHIGLSFVGNVSWQFPSQSQRLALMEEPFFQENNVMLLHRE